jgi:hypothetical protein
LATVQAHGINAGNTCIEDKVFFFEKKKQKTFAPAPASPDAVCSPVRGTHEQKFFGSFFRNITYFAFLIR